VKSTNPNKLKIFNDPVYGFVHIPFEIIYDLIEHPYFQRLRRIKQLGMTHLVYPGALHTRFHHAMGAMYLMGQAIEIIRAKGHEITDEEAEAVTVAVLLHDIGHGPFSHALEHSLVHKITHEDISALFMDRLNSHFEGRLALALKIFRNEYKKNFLHQLVSSQLDVDRLDYLKRDSFFTGVSEGVISSDRIIKMFNVVDDNLVVEAKGIYSIEKFIIARRLMYWQVYLHKTVLSAEHLLVKILKRAKELAEKGVELFATDAFKEFLYNKHDKRSFIENPQVLETFASLDDNDIFTSIKVWANHSDKILSSLCYSLVNRKLSKIEIQKEPFDNGYLEEKKQSFMNSTGFSEEEASYFIFSGSISNNAYNPSDDRINILYKDNKIVDIAEAADQLNISALSTPVKKYFACYPKIVNKL
jgi:uncharacterized protein